MRDIYYLWIYSDRDDPGGDALAALVVTGAAVTQLSACKTPRYQQWGQRCRIGFDSNFRYRNHLAVVVGPGSATAATGRKHSLERESAQQLIGGITKSRERAMAEKPGIGSVTCEKIKIT